MLTFETLVPTAPKHRFSGISRTYTPQDVRRLRGSICIQPAELDRGNAQSGDDPLHDCCGAPAHGAGLIPAAGDFRNPRSRTGQSRRGMPW
jgi:hypothetical protein